MVWGTGVIGWTEIFEFEGFTKPRRFNQEMVNHIASKKNRNGFEKTLERYNIKDARDARDCRGCSLLHITAERDNAEVAKYLITALGYEINVTNEHGQTALMIAMKKQHFDVAKTLLELNADISVHDIFGMNVLQITIVIDITTYGFEFEEDWLSQYWEMVGILLDRLDADNSYDSEKIANELWQINCPLTHVVFIENTEVLKIMIEKGSLINIKDRYSNRTALHLSIQYWKLDKVKILLDNGAAFNVLDHCKKSPMMCIYDNIEHLQIMPPCEVELVTILVKHLNKMILTNKYEVCLVDQLFPIFRYGSVDAIRVTVMESDDDLFLLKNEDRFTLLHVIAENRNPGVVEVLKGKKLDINATSKYGETALGHALYCWNCNMVEYLLSQGALSDVEKGHYPECRTFVPVHLLESKTEERLQCMTLILEYGRDEEIFVRSRGNAVSDLDHAFPNDFFRSDNTDLAKPVLAQLAIRESLDTTIPDIFRKKIESHHKPKAYYDFYVKELQEAKSSVMCKSISVFDFLTASDKMISLYARNRNLVSNLSKTINPLKLSSYYMELVQKRCSKILRMVQSREKAEKIICECIGVLYECNAIVTRLIVDYLDDEDVEKLL